MSTDEPFDVTKEEPPPGLINPLMIKDADLHTQFDPNNDVLDPDAPKTPAKNRPAVAQKGRGPLNRITVVEHVTHNAENKDTEAFVGKFTRYLSTNRPAHVYKGESAGQLWNTIDLGRITSFDDVDMVIIRNMSGTYLRRTPSAEERAVIDSTIIQVGVSIDGGEVIPFCEVPPTQHVRFNPVPGQVIHVRCTGPVAAIYNLFIVPNPKGNPLP